MRTVLLVGLLAVFPRHGDAEPRVADIELGIGGSPVGRVGLQSIVRVGEYETGILFGGGVGLTGAIAAVGVDQVFAHRTHATRNARWKLDVRYSVYTTYSLGYLTPQTRRPFGTHEEWIRDGNYHWIDAGFAMRSGGERFYIGLGVGVTVLAGHPEPLGVEMVEDEDLLWPLFPEGWTRQQGWGPVIWSNVGVRL